MSRRSSCCRRTPTWTQMRTSTRVRGRAMTSLGCRCWLLPGHEASSASSTPRLPLASKYTRCRSSVINTHTHLFDGPFSGTSQVSRYQKGESNLDFTEARDSEWQWHQLGHMQVCTLLQTDNHASTPPLSFSQAGCPSCRSTNSVKALKAQ